MAVAAVQMRLYRKENGFLQKVFGYLIS